VTAVRPVFVIAEAGVNHNGDIDRALALVDVAADAGADAVKFQTFRAASLVSGAAAKADYQLRQTGGEETQLQMLQRLELSTEDHRRLHARCAERGIEFMSTAFDSDSLDFLADAIGLRRIKIASGDLTNAPLLLHAARKRLPLLLSTGMGTLDEVADALDVLAFGLTREDAPAGRVDFAGLRDSQDGRAALRERVTVLHCTTDYPCRMADVNLRAMQGLADAFGLPVGLSDHSPGIAVPTAAAARGAVAIEKHVTLDRGLPGPDHAASLQPDELAAMVAAIRAVELALGVADKAPTAAEARNIAPARRSLVAAVGIARGERFGPQNLAVKRPGSGLSPTLYWDMLGRVAARDYAPDEPIEA
jgi:N-acetylneuraminate synthase